jgi:hypothetical protein
MRVKFKQIINRLTGITMPVFGINWNPPTAHVTVARNVITFLEDRRVLYNPFDDVQIALNQLSPLIAPTS